MDGPDGAGAGFGEDELGEDLDKELDEELDLADLDEEERGMFVALVEGDYAEALYLETEPPSPAEYAREARGRLAGDAGGLEDLETEIRERCELAAFRVAAGDRSYENHREIYGAEAHRAALARRRRAREAVGRWRRGETDSFEEVMDISDEIRRAERPQ